MPSIMRGGIIYLTVAAIFTTAAVIMGVLLTLNIPMTPHVTITVLSPWNKTVPNAYVQVFALLPP